MIERILMHHRKQQSSLIWIGASFVLMCLTAAFDSFIAPSLQVSEETGEYIGMFTTVLYYLGLIVLLVAVSKKDKGKPNG